MKTIYKDCTIEVFRDKPITGGDKLLFYSVFDEDDGYEVTSGFSEGMDSIWTWTKCLKATVDEYRLNPSEFKEEL